MKKIPILFDIFNKSWEIFKNNFGLLRKLFCRLQLVHITKHYYNLSVQVYRRPWHITLSSNLLTLWHFLRRYSSNKLYSSLICSEKGLYPPTATVISLSVLAINFRWSCHKSPCAKMTPRPTSFLGFFYEFDWLTLGWRKTPEDPFPRGSGPFFTLWFSKDYNLSLLDSPRNRI